MDVASFLFKRDTRALLYRPHLVNRAWVLSFMSVAELRLWALKRSWGRTLRARLTRHLRRYLIRQSDAVLCQRWATVVHARRRIGRPLGTADAWIAATALQLGVPLVTHNVADYHGVSGLTVLTEGQP
jgi:predicted nucleic acid-binding protein